METFRDGFVTPDDAARYLAVTRTAVMRLIKSGDISAVKFGKSWSIPMERLRRYAAGVVAESLGDPTQEDREDTPPVVHLNTAVSEDGACLTRCSLVMTDPTRVTSNREDVTCGRCRRIENARRRA